MTKNEIQLELRARFNGVNKKILEHPKFDAEARETATNQSAVPAGAK